MPPSAAPLRASFFLVCSETVDGVCGLLGCRFKLVLSSLLDIYVFGWASGEGGEGQHRVEWQRKQVARLKRSDPFHVTMDIQVETFRVYKYEYRMVFKFPFRAVLYGSTVVLSPYQIKTVANAVGITWICMRTKKRGRCPPKNCTRNYVVNTLHN